MKVLSYYILLIINDMEKSVLNKMKLRKRTVIIISLSSLALITSPFWGYNILLFTLHKLNPDYLEIDSCLDSSEKWNYEEKKCESTIE
jgi:hypothetical protein